MSTLAHKIDSMQDYQEGEHKVNKDDRRTTEFVRGLLNDYGTHGVNGFGLDVRDLPFYIQKLFLVIFTDRDHYYDCDDDYVKASIARNIPAMQSVVNSNAAEVCQEILSGLYDYVEQHKHDHNLPRPCRTWMPRGLSVDSDDWFTQTYAGY